MDSETRSTPFSSASEDLALHLGDCREVLATMADCSVDSAVCDPPYEILFMGRKWDGTGIAYDVALWREVLRVLKPGGHLLAFGGTRTYHRMACAIEDAGFEIRDSIHYMYGSGFPKSLNVERELAKRGHICECDDNVRGVRQDQADVGGVDKESQGADLLEGMQRPPSCRGTQKAFWPRKVGMDGSELEEFYPKNVWRSESGMEGGCDGEEESRELFGGALRQVPAGVHCDGQGGRVRDGAPAGDGNEPRPMPRSDGGCSPQRSQSGEQRPGESGAFREQRGPQACRRCGKTRAEWAAGIGTALKPAHEPVVLARKPLVGTVASNVLAHGTGAINVDGCRIASDGSHFRSAVSGRSGGMTAGDDREGGALGMFSPGKSFEPTNSPLGRWPSNVLFSHLEDCEPDACAPGCAVAELDGQSGLAAPVAPRKGGFRSDAASKGNVDFKSGSRATYPVVRGDSGGASRFFYCAKPSRGERDAGCAHLPAKTGGEATGREDGSVGVQNPRAGAGRGGGARNHHPTVKPITLMRYLCRLVTPQGGIVLDPFLGSGTTGCAAVLEGFRFIGIEMSPEYLEIARCRIAHHAGTVAAEDDKQGDLFRPQ